MSDYINQLFPQHPTLEQPTPEELAKWSPEQVRQLSRTWNESISAANSDPLRFGDHPPHWHDLLGELEDPEIDGVACLGANRSGKTSVASWLVVRALLENPGTIIQCWSQNKDTSHLVQQPRVYQMLPPELRKIRDDDKASIHYKIATGFVNDRFYLPNGSQCRFHAYSQYKINSTMIEGIELGWKGRPGESPEFPNIGCWMDEYLEPPALMRTLEERLSTRNAKLLMTFTPIHQYTETVEEILDGMETIRTHRTLPDDPPQIRGMELPYIQRKPSRSVIYFATRYNEYHDYERTKRNMQGKPRDWVMMKTYGVPTKIISGKFPGFNRDKHLVPELPKLTTAKGSSVEYEPTRYHIVVPAGDRPFFMIWVAVDENGNHCIYREWPQYLVDGAFAERRDGEWAWGDACKGDCCGMGAHAYKRKIEELEGGEEIEERIMFSGMEAMADDMADVGMVFSEVDDEGEQEGFQLIHTMLEVPLLQIVENCENVVGGIIGYDVEKQRSNKAHPWKPVIDALRLMAQAQLAHRLKDDDPSRGQWGGY